MRQELTEILSTACPDCKDKDVNNFYVDMILELIKKKLPSRGMLDNRYTKAKVGDRVFVSVDELLDKLEDKS